MLLMLLNLSQLLRCVLHGNRYNGVYYFSQMIVNRCLFIDHSLSTVMYRSIHVVALEHIYIGKMYTHILMQ